jgi:lipopolysaccharide biosynthesis glycosyltransferase
MEGYLYIAIGDQFVKEATRSAQSLRKIDSTANITLVTDKKIDNPIFDNVFVEPADIRTYRDGLLYKVKHIYQSSPYDETLFLDSDTYVCESCKNLFELLEFFDIAMAPDPTDPFQAKSPKSFKRIKACTPYNTGVILFKKNQINNTIFTKWLEIYQSKLFQETIENENDQTSFMEAWLQSDSKIYVLSHAWNARTPFFFTLNQSVKIIHGRHRNYEVIQDKLNRPLHSKHRCWLPVQEKCAVKKAGLLYQYKGLGKKLKDKLFSLFPQIK